MAATCTITSQTITNSAVNLTTKGGQDYHCVNGSGTLITKTGGGSKISVFGYDSGSHTRDIAYTSFNYGGGFASTPVTTTDGTPSDVTSNTACAYLVGAVEMGFIPRVTMAVGTQAVEINIGIFMNTARLPCHVKVTSPSAGVLLDVDLTGFTADTDQDKVLILSCVVETAEDWDFDVSNKVGGSGAGGYFGNRYVHLGTASGGDTLMGQACI
jgi:hypothetical protein